MEKTASWGGHDVSKLSEGVTGVLLDQTPSMRLDETMMADDFYIFKICNLVANICKIFHLKRTLASYVN